MKSQLSLHERIRNANASQEVEKVKARHTYLHGRADATGEWADIWSRDPNCSWAHIFGRMRGFDQIWHGSVAQYDKMSFENAIELMEIYPETAGKDPRPLMEASVHTLVTDIIEVAEDGMSARLSELGGRRICQNHRAGGKRGTTGHTWGSTACDRSGAAAFALLCSWKAAEHSAMAGTVPYTG